MLFSALQDVSHWFGPHFLIMHNYQKAYLRLSNSTSKKSSGVRPLDLGLPSTADRWAVTVGKVLILSGFRFLLCKIKIKNIHT